MKKRFDLSGIFANNWLYLVIIILEIGGIIPFFKLMADQSWILWLIAYAVGYGTFIYILNQDQRPSTKIPWLCIVLIMPAFGALFYGLFHEHKLKRKDREHLASLKQRMSSQTTNLDRAHWVTDPEAAGKVHALFHDDPTSAVYQNTVSKYYPVGESMYADMLTDLRSAKSFIFLEYFIVEPGVMWDGILEILKTKVKEGVEVRMMYDDLCTFTTLPMNYDKTLRDMGIQCYRFSKFTPIASTVHNNRDHRKIMVIDGLVGYTGGINLADEYINQKRKYGHWKDGGIRLQGDAVWGLSKLFLTNWDMNQKTFSDYQHYQPIQPQLQEAQGYYVPFGSGPKPAYLTTVGENAFLNLINQAKQSVTVMTPYLIIDYELTDALRNAAIRGVNVAIITPHIPDKRLIFLMTQSSYQPLFDAGVHVYEYVPGFVHMKMMLVDDEYGISGTINFDYRSLVHHYEDAVWMYQTPVLTDMKQDVEATIAQSQEVTIRTLKIGPFQRLIKSCVQLVAPLL